MEGWIKLHRQIMDNPVVMKDSDHLAVWIYLLLNATHKEYPAIFKGEKITLKPGQLLTGRKSIAEKLAIQESKVKRILTSFENDQQIDRQRGNKNSLISIVRWSEYQECDQQNDQQMTNKRPTSDQQVTTNKNVKNVRMKECKNIYIEPPELNDAILSFIEFRKKVKKPMTNRAVSLLIGKLNKLTPNTDEQIEILEQSIMNGWLSIYPLKEDAPVVKAKPVKEGRLDWIDDI